MTLCGVRKHGGKIIDIVWHEQGGTVCQGEAWSERSGDLVYGASGCGKSTVASLSRSSARQADAPRCYWMVITFATVFARHLTDSTMSMVRSSHHVSAVAEMDRQENIRSGESLRCFDPLA